MNAGGLFMKMFLDCLPCSLRQALEAGRMATDRPELQEKILEDSLKILSGYKNYRCSPDMARDIHLAVKEITGISDPYESIKKRDIQSAKNVYPILVRFLQEKGNSLYWALKIAATGNIIDSAVYHSDRDIEECLEKELQKEFNICDIGILEEKLKTAKNLLVIADNAGETVFDRILAEHFKHLDITYAVRSGPIINDATVQDALASGLGDCTRVISTGCSTPGVILEETSREFMEVFNSADIVFSKGQGNFEAISDPGRPLFYLLKAKCTVIAREFGVALNEYIFKYIGI